MISTNIAVSKEKSNEFHYQWLIKIIFSLVPKYFSISLFIMNIGNCKALVKPQKKNNYYVHKYQFERKSNVVIKKKNI